MGWTNCPKKLQYIDNKNNGLATRPGNRTRDKTEKKMER